jgi:hypothetical protein
MHPPVEAAGVPQATDPGDDGNGDVLGDVTGEFAVSKRRRSGPKRRGARPTGDRLHRRRVAVGGEAHHLRPVLSCQLAPSAIAAVAW